MSIDIETTSAFSKWLREQKISLAFTSYRAGKLITLGTSQVGRLTASDCNLQRFMGLGVGERKLWVASASHMWRFENVLEAGQTFETHDAVFLPVQSHLTGAVDVHDIAETNDGLPVFVVPRFNCLATLSDGHSFKVLWKPPFIDQIVAEDRCHLNGMAFHENAPRYVTCVAQTNESGAWREHRENGGVVLDVQTGDIVAEGLSMPHSPRLHEGKLWLHESGTGRFGHLDLVRGTFEPIADLNGFPRGLTFHKNWAIIGLSKPRHESGFEGLPLEKRLKSAGAEAECMIVCLNIKTGMIEHSVKIGPNVDEIYDVSVFDGISNPRLIDPKSDDARFFIRPDPNHQ